ncbi:MAG TPA: hypothetical protein ENH80_06925, partial [Phycisphaerae bacterium]|nr:hypothetical protein [Phycisphaerae bacterium]
MTDSVTSPDVSKLFTPKAVRATNAAWRELLGAGNIPAEQADFGLLAKQDILAALADDNTAVIAGFFYRDNDGDGAYTPGEAATATVLGLPTLAGPGAGEATGYCTSYCFGPLKAGETYSVSYDVEGVESFSAELTAQPGLNLVHLPIVPTKPLVYVVPHSHFDPEWRDTYDGYILREVPQLLDRIKLL